jgi:hypothetical protein
MEKDKESTRHLQMASLEKLKQLRQDANSSLFKECGLFFAFSQKQFDESKTPLKEGEKYVSVLGGGYVPKGNLNKLLEGMEEIRQAYEKAIKDNNLRLTEVVYEFNNHECFYTGDWPIVANMFPDIDPAVIHHIYTMEHRKHIEWCKETNSH